MVIAIIAIMAAILFPNLRQSPREGSPNYLSQQPQADNARRTVVCAGLR
ncbi:MAG: hypothetical protein ACYC63_05315 [Armatimonadota bacterium]